MSKVFLKNDGDVIHTENRSGFGFINIPPGMKVEIPSKELAEGIIQDSKRWDLKLIVEEDKPKVQLKKPEVKKEEVKQVLTSGKPQANK